MEFSFTDEQLMIQETASGFLAEVSTSEAVRAAMVTELGYEPDVWKRVCEDLFLHAVTIPEEFGGMGLGYVELITIMERIGKHLFCSPYFSTVCLATNALLIAGTDEQKQTYFERIIAGETATLAFNDASGTWGAESVSCAYTKQGDAFVLNGEYRHVVNGSSADFMVVAAREAGSVSEKGISLFIVDAKAEGIQADVLPTVDQTRKLAHVTFSNVSVPAAACMQSEAAAWPLLSTIIQLSTVCVAAEQTGGAQRVIDMSVEYMQERSQFNRPIASFQALKHKVADMQLKTEVATSAIYYAACVAQEVLLGDAGDAVIASELMEASSMAKAHCSDAYFYNAGSAIQLHGGVGFTWEYDVHLYFKRAKASQHFLGDATYHREQIARVLLDSDRAYNEGELA